MGSIVRVFITAAVLTGMLAMAHDFMIGCGESYVDSRGARHAYTRAGECLITKNLDLRSK